MYTADKIYVRAKLTQQPQAEQDLIVHEQEKRCSR